MKSFNKILVVLLILNSFMVGCNNQEIPNDDDLASMVSINKSSSENVTIETSNTVVTTTIQEKKTVVTTVPTSVTKESTSTTTTETLIFDYPLSEINAIAKDLYSKACEKYRSVLIEGCYGVDFQKYVVDESGKKYFWVYNSDYPNVDSVLEDWHTVFTSNFDDLVYGKYLMCDDELYCYTSIQQKNTNYTSTDLIYYYSHNENELTFKANCHYSSGDKVFKFSMLYYPDTDEWRVSEFTMPY